MSDTELKPCPFCGSTDIKPHNHEREPINWFVCGRCSAEGPGGLKEDPVKLWNKRANEFVVAGPETTAEIVDRLGLAQPISEHDPVEGLL